MKNRLLLALLLNLLATAVWAQAAVPLTISDLIVLSLEKNIGLQVEKVNIPLSETAIKIESAAFDSEFFAAADIAEETTPVSVALSADEHFESEQLSAQLGLRKRFSSGLSGSFSLNSNRTTDNNSSENLDPRYRTALVLDLTQPLLRNFGAPVNTTQLQVSRNQNQQQSYRYFLQAQSLALQVESLALQFAGETEIVKLRQEAVGLAAELYSANQRRFESGVIPVSEVQEAQTDLANRELNLSLASQAVELSLEQLNRQLDHSLPSNFSADEIFRTRDVSAANIELNLPAFEDTYRQAKQRRLDLKISHLDIENTALQKNFFANQQQPQLDLKLQAGLNGLSGDERDPVTLDTQNGSWGDSFADLSDADGYQWRAGLEFSLPLGNQSAKARYRQATLRQRQAGYRQHDLESALKQELIQQQTILQRTAEQVAIANRFRILAEKSLHQERRRLEEGLSDTFRLILFQNNMINAKIDRISALTRYYQAVANMNFSRGIILEQHGITLKIDAQELNRADI